MAALAYAQSESVVNLLLERGGVDRLRALLDRIRETGDFEWALAETYRRSSAELEAEWIARIRDEGRPWWLETILSNLMPFLFFVASLLAIVGWWRIRRRGRETYESLPE